MKLEVLPLDQKTFSAYGDVIETQERDFFHINNGLVERYHDLAKVEVLEQDRTLISINRAQPAAMPIVVHELERHPLGTQAFVPMNGEAFVVIDAPRDKCAHFREINGIAAAFQYLQKNYNPTASSFL